MPPKHSYLKRRNHFRKSRNVTRVKRYLRFEVLERRLLLSAANVALGADVTLHGAPFFTGGTPGRVVSEDTVTDGQLFQRKSSWDHGPVWWDARDGRSRYLTINLGATYRIDSFIVQADGSDAYILSYWDGDSETWKVAWNVPNPSQPGMQTRPNPNDNIQRYVLPTPIVTDVLWFEGNTSAATDRLFSVSEIQAFGVPVGIVAKSVMNPSNGHMYHLITAPDGTSGVTWKGAEEVAVAMGGHLVTINDATENQWVADTFRGSFYPWIGLNDIEEEGRFVWSSGEPVTYENWYPGEPNNWRDLEHYGNMYNWASAQHKWNDNSERTSHDDGRFPTHGIAEVRPPTLTHEVINGGRDNRSRVTNILIGFDQAVTVNSVNSLKVFNHTTNKGQDISGATLQNNGTVEVTWDLSTVNFPNGYYTAELPDTEAVSTESGLPLAATHSFIFHVLSGDSTGDATVNFLDFGQLSGNFGQVVGPLGPGDLDGSGTVNFVDFGILSANFGESLAALAMDFGDAPEAGLSYPTTLANNGARHILGSGLYLGSGVDGEADGQPDGAAAGDDKAGDDEDGVIFGILQPGKIASVTVVATVPSGLTAVLNGWIDFNADGDWDDPGERIFLDQAVHNGVNSLTLSVPSWASVGSTFARFRIASTASRDPVLFSDRAAFNAATTGRTVVDFEHLAPDGGSRFLPTPPGISLSGTSFTIDHTTSSGGTLFVIGDGFYYADNSVLSSQGSSTGDFNVVVTLPRPHTAVAMDFGVVNRGINFPFTFKLSTGDTFARKNIGGPEMDFLGITSSIGIRSIRVSMPPVGYAENIDNFTFGTALLNATSFVGRSYSYFGQAPDGEVEDYQVTLVSRSSSSFVPGFGGVPKQWLAAFHDRSDSAQTWRSRSVQPVVAPQKAAIRPFEDLYAVSSRPTPQKMTKRVSLDELLVDRVFEDDVDLQLRYEDLAER